MKVFSNYFKPQKGKAYIDLPHSELNKFDTNTYAVSTKYDGNQIFIVKYKGQVDCYTSDWKQFSSIDNDTLTNNGKDFILIAEFMYGCKGKLGDRRNSAILTTWRTDYKKGIKSYIDPKKLNIKVFDCLEIVDGKVLTSLKLPDRLTLLRGLHLPYYMDIVDRTIMTGSEAKQFAKQKVREGWEGAMCISLDEDYKIGKRVNYSVKLKYRKTADLLCIDIVGGEGKYTGQIGSLVLQDKKGRIVAVGSGLDDTDRVRNYDYFLNKVIEIEYEQIMDTYIQPVVVCVRDDKTTEDID